MPYFTFLELPGEGITLQNRDSFIITLVSIILAYYIHVYVVKRKKRARDKVNGIIERKWTQNSGRGNATNKYIGGYYYDMKGIKHLFEFEVSIEQRNILHLKFFLFKKIKIGQEIVVLVNPTNQSDYYIDVNQF